MKQLTMKELSFIEDEIRAEEILGKTMNWCASLCDDQILKNELEKLAEQHQLNVASLSQYFNQSKMIQ
ncbi:hypothetical protein [Metabacillus halosaccharovorans]|uniref:Spore coat protein n=1 Tax=Metabacillus halosaccharovorans TaxID=930124 RepID=A0ABT3DG96_9BACI|nr:hypothetical protein [Metabacillus halosaccharovorans]MCV9885886.1 hypothetical protein [Metabacillus halosaccharovorans]